MNSKDIIDRGLVQDAYYIEYVNENGEKVGELLFKPVKTVDYIKLEYTKIEEVDSTR